MARTFALSDPEVLLYIERVAGRIVNTGVAESGDYGAQVDIKREMKKQQRHRIVDSNIRIKDNFLHCLRSFRQAVCQFLMLCPQPGQIDTRHVPVNHTPFATNHQVPDPVRAAQYQGGNRITAAGKPRCFQVEHGNVGSPDR